MRLVPGQSASPFHRHLTAATGVTAKSCAALAVLLLVRPGLARAKPTGIDFQKKTIFLEGVYDPKEKTPAVPGLEAELEARKQGIAHLKDDLKRTCPSLATTTASADAGDEDDDSQSSAPLRKGWQTAFRSQGSIIHPNGVLRVLLSAPLSSVFPESTRKAQSLKTNEGNEHIGFKLPGTIPMSALHCGHASTRLSAQTTADVWFVPTSRADLKVVNLVLDGEKVLKPASPDDQAIIDASNLSKLSPEGPKDSAYFVFPVVSN